MQPHRVKLAARCLVAATCLVPYQASALSEDYKFCAISGYFHAHSPDGFLTSLALQKRFEDKSKGTDATCQALWKEGKAVGERIIKRSAVARSDEEIFRAAAEFQARIESFVLKGAGY